MFYSGITELFKEAPVLFDGNIELTWLFESTPNLDDGMPHQLGEQSSEDKVAALVDDPEIVHVGTNLRQPYEGDASSDGEDSDEVAWYDNDVHNDLREQHERNLSIEENKMLAKQVRTRICR